MLSNGKQYYFCLIYLSETCKNYLSRASNGPQKSCAQESVKLALIKESTSFSRFQTEVAPSYTFFLPGWFLFIFPLVDIIAELFRNKSWQRKAMANGVKIGVGIERLVSCAKRCFMLTEDQMTKDILAACDWTAQSCCWNSIQGAISTYADLPSTS